MDDDPPLDDLDARLRERLRRASGAAGGPTRAELVELADALDRQRRQVAEALADLRRREEEAARVRTALERTSREAMRALDEREDRLATLAAELAAERERLDARMFQLDTAEEAVAPRPAEAPSSPSREPVGAADSMFAELRQRLERIEASLELRERLDRVEAAIAERVRTVREQAPAQLEERLTRLEELVSDVARLGRRPPADMPAPAVVESAAVETPPAPEPSKEPLVPTREPAPVTVTAHVLFVGTSSGYRLLEREGAPPQVGERVELAEFDGAHATVIAPRRSPFPGDSRLCLVCAVDGRPAA
ncbi:MAG: hypothetical protein ACJ77E_08280 [Gaiellaceae bacterium]